MIEISWIIPCHNEELYIKNCIQSIISEMVHYDYRYEIIVVDNNSDDDTENVARSAGAKVVYEKREGVPFARQRGFKASQYEYLAFVDADCKVPIGWVSVALNTFFNKAFFRTDEIVAVSGPLRFYDTPDYLNIAAEAFYVLARAFHNIWPTIQGGNYMIKRSALQAIGGFDTSYLFWGEDTRTAIQLSKIGRVKLNPELFINTSGRRLMKDGVFKTTGLYILNYLSTNILGKAATQRYGNFR